MMKRSIGIITLGALCALFSLSIAAQTITERVKSWLPGDQTTSLKLPSVQIPHFNLSQLNTSQAISNALQKIASAFSLLSPQTLRTIQKNQFEKLQQNMEAYAENPTWANRGAIAANALAIGGATIALAGEAAAVGAAGYLIGKKITEAPQEKSFEQEEAGLITDPLFEEDN